MVKYSFKTLAVDSASVFLQDIAREVALENQDALMTGAGFPNLYNVEVQQLEHTLSVDLLAERARNLGATGRNCADETALSESHDICFDIVH